MMGFFLVYLLSVVGVAAMAYYKGFDDGKDEAIRKVKIVLEEVKEPEKKQKKAGKVNCFKPGDIVKRIETGEIDTVQFVPGMKEYDGHAFISAKEGMMLISGRWGY